MVKSAAGTIVTLTAAAVIGAQALDTLDLTHRTSSSGPMTAGRVTVPATGPGSHEKRRHLDMSVRLESLDRVSYDMYDEFVFRMTLQNIGREVITLPWEPDSARLVTGPDAPTLTSVLVIDAETSTGERLTVPVATLFGSKLSPTSTKVLKPGQRVDIIATAQWHFLPAPPRKDVQNDLKISARMTFLTPIDGSLYGDLISSNKLPIMLNGKS